MLPSSGREHEYGNSPASRNAGSPCFEGQWGQNRIVNSKTCSASETS